MRGVSKINVRLGREDVESRLLDTEQFSSVLSSAESLLNAILDPSPTPSSELLWPGVDTTSGIRCLRLILLPMDRVGSKQGAGGTKVLAGYFEHGPRQNPFRSRPMIIKIDKPRGRTRTAMHQTDKLQDEYARAQKIAPYIGPYPEVFAIPQYFNQAGDTRPYGRTCSVLWSPLQSSKGFKHTGGGTKAAPSVYELCMVLRGQDSRGRAHYPPLGRPPLAVRSIEAVYKYLQPFHGLNGAPKKTVRDVNLIDQYKEWVGDFDTKWGGPWKTMWGAVTQKDCRETTCIGGTRTRWVNPCWVLHRLRTTTTQLCFGAVHGDLHPRNIVFNAENDTRVIDFGCASDYDHVAKDFVLMECNLRFMVLRADISCSTLAQMAQIGAFLEPLPTTGDRYCGDRMALIATLRAIAKKHLTHKCVDWNHEYIVPLFLVSFGLLDPVLHSRCDNQVSARMTVLSLAKYIAEAVLST